MASDIPSVQTPAISLVQGSQQPTQVLIQKSGNTLPQDGKVSAASSAAQPTVGQQSKSTAALQQQSATQSRQAQQQQEQQKEQADLASQVAIVNKAFNDSGRAAQFRASSNDKQIEEVNPATGEVIATYSAAVFGALARSVGISGAKPVVDEHA